MLTTVLCQEVVLEMTTVDPNPLLRTSAYLNECSSPVLRSVTKYPVVTVFEHPL